LDITSFTLLGVPLAAIAIAACTVPLARWLGFHFGITAGRAASSTDHELIPVFGGASIVAGILISLAAFAVLPPWVALGAGSLWIVGAIDDAFELRPRQKLAAQVIVSTIVAAAMPRFALTPWPLVNFVAVVFWLTAASNAFNLIDGLDGLAAGTGIVIATAIAITSIIHLNLALAVTALAVAGALAGFMIFNFPPASIFMGDAGALPVGILLGVLSLRAGLLPNNSHLTRFVYPILVMLMPLLDTGIVSVTRLATGNSISRHGLDHSHHRLLSLGLSERTAVSTAWAIAAIGAACATAASLLPHPYLLTTLPFAMVAAAMIALFMMDLTFDSNPPGLAYGYAQGLSRFILAVGYKRRVAEALIDVALISAAYLGANLLRRNFVIDDATVTALTFGLGGVLLATYPAFLLTGVYRGIWRYTGLSDGIRFANASVLAGIFLVPASMLWPIYLSGSVLILYVILLFNLLVLTRSSFQTIRQGIAYLSAPTERIVVVGAGRSGIAAATYIFSERKRGVRLVGFIDDDGFKQGKLVHGQRVLGTCSDLERVYRDSPFDLIMIADDELSRDRIERIRTFALRHDLSVRRFTIALSEIHDLDSDSVRETREGTLAMPR
jgi:UDP-GlcNAc:undecaprenyl-phosphate GlcNAc-1-phosphate transferase